MENDERNRKGIVIGYALAGAGAAFYYGLSTNSTFLTIVYAILSLFGSAIMIVSSWESNSGETRTKMVTSNIVYIIIINILGILSKIYGGLIAFILIVIAIFSYENFLKRSQYI